MKRFVSILCAFLFVLASSAGVLAALTKDEQKCVKTLQKDGVKVASARAKELGKCLKGAHKGDVADLGACLDAAAGGKVVAAAERGSEDAVSRCWEAPAGFGLPPSFDLAISEAAQVHARGLLGDFLGDSPAAAGDKVGNKCQAAVVGKAAKLAGAHHKAFAKCMKNALKDGAGDSAALVGCAAPDVTAKAAALAGAVEKKCEGVESAAVLPGLCTGLTGTALAECAVNRTLCRACRLAATAGALDADCDLADDGQANDSCSFPVTLSGDALNFVDGTRVEGADITVLEHPGMLATTGADGHFEFPGLEEGSEVTLVLDHPDYHPIQTGTIRLGAAGAERVTFQSVTWDIYDAFAAVLEIVPDEANACQMVTTVTRVGKSIYDSGAHGEDNATVTLAPALPELHGPVYFNAAVIPDRSLGDTSADGGVLHLQVPPGEYVWTAHKFKAIFTRIKMKCRVGFLVNASPPWGLQRQ